MSVFSRIGSLWWIVFPAPMLVRAYIGYMLDVEESCLLIAAITGEDVDLVRRFVRRVAREDVIGLRSAARKVEREAMLGESVLLK